MLSKHFKSETREIMRSEIIPAPYNPRVINKDERNTLKSGIKRYGVVGGFVWNELSAHLVSGHQKLSILDELHKYDPKTKENDYSVKVEVIYVDDKTEKELNILLNNPHAQGEWNYDKLAELIPDIDYKNAGLTDEDMQLIGIDIVSEVERDIEDDLDSIGAPLTMEKEQRKAEIKAKKERVQQGVDEKVGNIESYVVVNFDSYKEKSAFMLRFGFSPTEKFINGNLFSEMIERVD